MVKITIIEVPYDFNKDAYINEIKDIINIEINYKNPQSIIAWRWLLKLLSSEIDNQSFKFYKNKFNKPYLLNHKKYFNISHSSNKIIIGISDNEIGVDIQKIKEVNLKIAKRYFSLEEQKYIFYNLDNKSVIERFFIIWSLKESYLKFKGIGLKQKLGSFSVKPKSNFNYLDNRDFKLAYDNIDQINLDRNIILKYNKIEDFIISYTSLNDINLKVNFVSSESLY